MGTPNSTNICANCGEPIIWYNNTGPWKHYPEHPLTSAPTDCMVAHVKQKDKVTPALPTTSKTAVGRL